MARLLRIAYPGAVKRGSSCHADTTWPTPHWRHSTCRAEYRNPAVGDPELLTFRVEPRTAEPAVLTWRDRKVRRIEQETN